MSYVHDKFGSILGKDSIVVYIENGEIERGRVVEAIKSSRAPSVKIEPFKTPTIYVVRSASVVMKVLLPAT